MCPAGRRMQGADGVLRGTYVAVLAYRRGVAAAGALIGTARTGNCRPAGRLVAPQAWRPHPVDEGL